MRCSGYYPSYAPPPAYSDPQAINIDDQGITAGNNLKQVESTHQQAQQLLQDVLALGLTYDDLLAEGMHPAFLDQLFARLHLQSPRLVSRAPSVPHSTATPDIQYSTPPITQKTLDAEVESFLNNLEPVLPTSNGKGHKKRRYPDNDTHPPKRRAFGLAPPAELVIEISDDDDDGEHSPVKPTRHNRIPDRPTLTQEVVPVR